MQIKRILRCDYPRLVALSAALLSTAPLSAVTAPLDSFSARESESWISSVRPNPLLTIDQNRTTVVDRIVATWGDPLVGDAAGLNKDDLRALLTGLRSDQLLAAS